MEIKVPTIAERKAARRSSILIENPSQPQPSFAAEIQSPQVPAPKSPVSDPQFTSNTAAPAPEGTSLSLRNTSIPASPSSLQQPFKMPETSPGRSQFSKEDLIQLARSMGLEVGPPKRIWIKHSFSITPESKEKFQERCKALGIKMQDALEEALQNWFEATQTGYSAIQRAKDKS